MLPADLFFEALGNFFDSRIECQEYCAGRDPERGPDAALGFALDEHPPGQEHGDGYGEALQASHRGDGRHAEGDRREELAEA